MHKHHFFTLPQLIKDDVASLPEDEAHHAVNVLRLKVSDRAVLFDGSGFTFNAEVIQINPLEFRIIEKNSFEPNKKLTICVGLAKSKKLDLIVRQLTEIGCYKIVIFSSKRSVPLLSDVKVEKRLSRWRKITVAASKQSRREYLPEIVFYEWDEFIENLEPPAATLYEKSGLPLENCIKRGIEKATLIIGPEGGFEDEEISQLKKAGSRICSTGKYILRVETAAIFAASVATTLMSN